MDGYDEEIQGMLKKTETTQVYKRSYEHLDGINAMSIQDFIERNRSALDRGLYRSHADDPGDRNISGDIKMNRRDEEEEAEQQRRSRFLDGFATFAKYITRRR